MRCRQIKKKNKSPRRGIEPRSGTRQAPILTIKLSRINDFVVLMRIYSVYKRRVNIIAVLNIYSHVISPLLHEFVLQATNSELGERALGLSFYS